MAAALVSALTGRPLRGDIAMTGEIGLCGQVLPVAGIKEKVLAAHRWGLTRVILPRQNRKQVDEDLGDELRRAVAVDYVTGIDELLKLALGRAPAPEAAGADGHAARPDALSRGDREPPKPGQGASAALDVEPQGGDADRDRARQGVPLAAAGRARPRAGGVAHDSAADAADADLDGDPRGRPPRRQAGRPGPGFGPTCT